MIDTSWNLFNWSSLRQYRIFKNVYVRTTTVNLHRDTNLLLRLIGGDYDG